MGQKFCRVKKKWVGNVIGLKEFGSEIWFGLIRFVCDLLLITAKLNNNNAEFVWWVDQYTHNLVKPTSTWLWFSWVLTITNHFLSNHWVKFYYNVKTRLIDFCYFACFGLVYSSDRLRLFCFIISSMCKGCS